MPRFRLLASLTFLGGLIAAPAFAQVSAINPGQLYSAGGGARGLAMGSALTSVAGDISSLYYNPSGLATMSGRQITAMQASLYDGAAYQYLGYGQGLRRSLGGFGLEVMRLGISGADGRDASNLGTGSFGYSEQSIGAGFGMRGVLHPDLSVGMKVHRLTRSLGGSSDNLTGVDFGGMYGPIFGERLTLGFIVQNALQKSQGDTSDKLAAMTRVGAAYNLTEGFLLAADVSSDKDFRIGTEYNWGIATFRAGYTGAGVSFGTGLLFRQALVLDLAMVNSSVLGNSTRVSLGYKFREAAAKRNVQAIAEEYLANALLELKARDYVRASKGLDAALGISPRLGELGWKVRAQRLRSLVIELDLANLPEFQEIYKAQTAPALLAHEGVMALLDEDNARAMLFVHAALGQNSRESAYRKLLEAMSRLTKGEIHREDILPPSALVERRLQRAVDQIYGGHYDTAISDCKDALALDPNNATAWMRLGSAYFAAGDKSDAASAYRNSLSLDPTNERLRQFMQQQRMPL